jgi:hypothetical protein
MKKLVRAYFCPLDKGMSADEVAEYLDGDDGALEIYLRE